MDIMALNSLYHLGFHMRPSILHSDPSITRENQFKWYVVSLHDKNRIAADVIQPAQHRGLLIIANHVSDLVHPNSLRSGLEILRTVSTPDFILCFHIIDL